MALFDNRKTVSRILSRKLGFEYSVQQVFEGSLESREIGIRRKAVLIASTDDGFWVVDGKSEVAALQRKHILKISQNLVGDGLAFLVKFPGYRNSYRDRRYPLSEWFEVEIWLRHAGDGQIILNQFAKSQLELGFTQESLRLYDKWLTFSAPPDSQEPVFHRAEQFASTDAKESALSNRARANDALQNFYYVARNVCQGKFPNKLLEDSLHVWQNLEHLTSKPSSLDVVTENLISQTLNLKSKIGSNFTFLICEMELLGDVEIEGLKKHFGVLTVEEFESWIKVKFSSDYTDSIEINYLEKLESQGNFMEFETNVGKLTLEKHLLEVVPRLGNIIY